MSDEVREAQAGRQRIRRQAKIRNWRLEKNRSRNQLQKRNRRKKKIPRKSPLGKSWQKKNRQAKAALEREIKREIAEKEQQDENSAGWISLRCLSRPYCR